MFSRSSFAKRAFLTCSLKMIPKTMPRHADLWNGEGGRRGEGTAASALEDQAGVGQGSGRSGSEDGSPGFQAALPTLPLLPLFILRCFLHCSLLLEVRDELW